LAVATYAQTSRSCTVFNLNEPPPDYATYGSCKSGQNTLSSGASCSISCYNDGPSSMWRVAGAPYTCTDGVLSGGPQFCVYENYQSGASNCSVSSWSSITPCTFGCGQASATLSRSINSYGSVGGVPCPALSFSFPCQNGDCNTMTYEAGYWKWGPFCAGTNARTINFMYNTFGNNIDMYLFDSANFNRYTWDAALTTPQNSYYYPVEAYLNNYYQSSSFVVPAGQCYTFVLDNTNVGPGKPANTNMPFFMVWQFSGTTSNDGFVNYNMQEGYFQPASAFRASVSFFGAFVTLVLVIFLKLE